jgi:hypothetical protein
LISLLASSEIQGRGNEFSSVSYTSSAETVESQKSVRTEKLWLENCLQNLMNRNSHIFKKMPDVNEEKLFLNVGQSG